jgi:ubiquinone/menaquinone biosynthesis C-methylase UbiE
VGHAAGLAFDSIAEQYDELFTRSLIGRAQRNAVWAVLRSTFRPGERVLELNCGTGEDALFLARMGVSVLACDASPKMISVAERRMATEASGTQVKFEVRPTERIAELRGAGSFDGVFSNFSGLNCIADLGDIARQLSILVKPGGRLLLCFSTRFCLWESLWYLVRGEPKRAIRRWKGHAGASLGDVELTVKYPTMREIRKQVGPMFSLQSCRGIGVAVPPSYLEHLARRHPGVLQNLEAIDRCIAGWPVCRVIGDHVLLALERNR